VSRALHRSRRLGRKLLTLAGALVPACSREAEESPPSRPQRHRPSVLLITLDTTRADHLGCYGAAKSTSPNLDRLAGTGTLFTSAVAQASVTPVSHASILTGLNPYAHGLRVLHGLEENRLSDSRETLAEVLKKDGYRTAAFVSAFPVTQRFGLHQGFDTFDAAFLSRGHEDVVSADGTVNTGEAQQGADVTTDRALAWLAGAKDPFFLWVHYFDPHDPRVKPSRDALNRLGIVPEPQPDLHAHLRHLYDLELRFMDHYIGQVLDELKAAGRLDEMIVVVVADHGEGLGDHGWWTHGILYQEQVRLALMIRAPGKPAGRRVDYVVRSIDIMPTVLDLVRLDASRRPAMDGRSLVPLLSGDAPDPKYVAYSDSVDMLTYRFVEGVSDVKTDQLFAVHDGRWKYIHHLKRPDESELFDLLNDPKELHNLASDQPQELQRLRGELMQLPFLPSGKEGKSSMPAEDLERLRSLGYVR